MDRWTEIFIGSEVWYSTRELYDVVVLCIANRSVVDHLIEVDFGESDNAEAFIRAGGGTGRQASSLNCRLTVPACTTKVAATFHAPDKTRPLRLKIVCSIVHSAEIPLVDVHRETQLFSPPDADAAQVEGVPHSFDTRGTTMQSREVERQSMAVQSWLEGRKRRADA